MGKLAAGTANTLRGRSEQLVALEQTLNTARAGSGTVLVLRGEAGIGKTALLRHVEAHAIGFRTVGVSGIEAEMVLPYASLQQLCAPMMSRLHDLTAPQREALSIAFGLAEGEAANRLLVGMAVLGLMATATEDQPLVCIVDDAQWLDETSMQVLTFVAKHLAHTSVALIFALQELREDRTAGLPDLAVEGLSIPDARALLDSVVCVPLDPLVRDRIVAEAHGNPTALLELPSTLAPTELAGGFWLPDSHSLTSYLESAFHRRFRLLPPDSQRLLQIAAAEPTGDVDLLFRAAGSQGIAAAAAAPAVSSGLIQFDTGVCFQHPMVRSAVYRRMSVPDRQAVHQALAEATDPETAPDRRAWHRAHTVTQPDESVARDLEDSAGRARLRGGIAASASFLHRSAELTPDRERHVARALAAAQVEVDAGAVDDAYGLLATAEAGPLDSLQHAQLDSLRASLMFSEARGGAAPLRLLESANRLTPLAPASARDTLLEAAGALVFAGRLNEGTVREHVAAAARAGPLPQKRGTVDDLLDSVVGLTVDGSSASVQTIKHAVRTVREEQTLTVLEGGSRLRLAHAPIAQSLALEVWDDEAWEDLTAGAVHQARAEGALAVLPLALDGRACFHVFSGEFDAAAAEIAEVSAISAVTGAPDVINAALVLGGWKAQQVQNLDRREATIKEAGSRGEGRVLGLADYAAAVQYNGLGRYDAALAAATSACRYEDLGTYGWALVELIEAASRTGEPTAAAGALAELAERTSASGTAWARGTEACAQALLSDGPAAQALYQEAIEALGSCRMVMPLARARLLYGEWLRRESRRQESRTHLRSACEVFDQAGADCFAERARRELSVTGDTVRKRTVGADLELTKQETQIARLAEKGHTNAEIANQLFISPRTVEWHLGNIFAKLGVSSRRHLHAALPPLELQ
ncbi:helix-turn-helix transcriptional regulator [Streptomyces fructofermentans]|uniref:helix-turn-helix transcriptional regulator n=1 Tax=Streptomyces fructofermentans TaxID=152141 RepID=UPI0037B9B505